MTRDDHTIKPYLPFNSNLIRLLGYYISEGYIRDEPTSYQTNFSVAHPIIRNHLHHLITTLLGSEPYHKKDNNQLAHTGRIHAYLFAYAWKMGRSAITKRIPSFVMNLPKEYRLQFLSAIIDGDGSIITRSCRTTIYAGSERLAQDYSFLLSTLGVFARIHQAKGGQFDAAVLARYDKLDIGPKKTTGLFHVDIPGRENKPFLEDLSLVHPKKNEKRQTILAKGFPKPQRMHNIGNHIILDQIKKIDSIHDKKESYCLEVQTDVYHNNLYNNIVTSDLINCFQCDGDEDSVLLALDPMINFSRAYLPASRGGTMDTPLVLSVTVTPKEIDAEAHNIDGTGLYPLEFYQQAMQFVDPKDVEDIFDLVAHRVVDHRIELTAESYGLRYSHETSDINRGPRVTTYSKLKTMEEKVERQLALGARISAVDVQDMAQRLLDSHFFPDIFGNLRAFATQKFRCTTCNEKFRRIPLVGVCPKCSGKIVLTVTKAGITKYVNLASKIVQDLELPRYYQQRLDLARKVINSIFPPEESSQDITLKQFSA
jgi:DNA polymerase II large subunit